MKVLMIGDIIGEAGCEYTRKILPELKQKYDVDITIANGENSAKGNGITSQDAKFLFDSGIDVITTGNHGLRRREIYETFDERRGLIRPANYHPEAPGSGWYMFDSPRLRLCVINLQGAVYMQPIQSPFDCIDALLPQIDTPNIIVDFHAEATSEKQSMGYYLDGRVSAVVGTHTHVPTADARILPGGTGYVTDIGMCGGMNSALGVKSDLAVWRARTNLPIRFEHDPLDIRLSGVLLDIDEKTGKCTGIESLFMI